MISYFGAIWNCRHFWLSLVKLDLRTRYRRSVLGLGWSLLQPICMTVIYCVVFHKLFNQNIADYAPHLLAGQVVWAFIQISTLQGCQSFFQGEAYIRQCPMPGPSRRRARRESPRGDCRSDPDRRRDRPAISQRIRRHPC